MSPRKKLPDLNRTELDLMKILWSEEPLSAREVHDRVAERWGWAYSTTRTVLERMVGKRLVSKKEFHGINLYATKITRVEGLAGFVRDFAERVLELDGRELVPMFLRSDALTEEEVEELLKLLESGEGR